MSWRLAKSLEVLRTQVNKRWPNRSRDSDGSIGDASHQARVSDHDPNDAGVVCAIDITHDPKSGCDSYLLAEILRAAKDERVKYLISNGKICSGTGQDHVAWVWRPYTGANKHDHHIHISVKGQSSKYDDGSAWNIDVGVAAANLPDPKIPNYPATLRRGDKGASVRDMQGRLGKFGIQLSVDGDFGGATLLGLKRFQRDQKLVVDGVCGPQTWAALNKTA